MGDKGEYEETKVRVYKKTQHKDDSGKMQKVGHFLTKAFTPDKKSTKEKRLSA